MEQLIGIFKNEKISSSVLILLVLVFWYAYGWANEEHEKFVRHTDFNEFKDVMITHVEDMQIVNTSQLVRDKKLVLQLAQATDEPASRISDLEGEVTKAETYRQCLIEKKPNCKHLKPAE